MDIKNINQVEGAAEKSQNEELNTAVQDENQNKCEKVDRQIDEMDLEAGGAALEDAKEVAIVSNNNENIERGVQLDELGLETETEEHQAAEDTVTDCKMSANFCGAVDSLDEMLDQIQMETAPWPEEEESSAEETSDLKCTEELTVDDDSYEYFGEMSNPLKTIEITFEASGPSSSALDNGYNKKTLVTGLHNTRSSIFPSSEEPIAFKFASVLDKSSDFDTADETEGDAIVHQNIYYDFIHTDTDDSEIEDVVIDEPIMPIFKIASPPRPINVEKKSRSKKLKKMFSRIKRAFSLNKKKFTVNQ